MKSPLPFLYVILLSVLFISCDDSADVSDDSPPDITVTKPEGKSVAGTVNISAVLEDLSEEVAVKIVLDGVVVKEGTAKSIAFELDTKTISDGAHTLTIIATDANGNARQLEIPLVVRNTLLIIHVPDHYVQDNSEVYFIVSGNDGSLIAYQKAQNGSVISVPTPAGFNPDSSFVVTNFLHSVAAGSYKINTANISVGVLAGEYGLPFPTEARSISGQQSFSISDIPDGYFEVGGKNMVSKYGWSVPDASFNLGMFQHISDMFFYAFGKHGSRPAYAYLPEVVEGGQTAFSVEDLPLMTDHETTLKEVASYYSVRITGYDQDQKNGVQVYTDNLMQDVSSIPAFYPGTTFPNYFTSMSAYSSGIGYTYSAVGATPPSQFRYIDARPAGVSLANGRFEARASGNYDFGMASAYEASFVGSELTIRSYYVNFPKGKTRMTMPSLPQFVFDKGLPSMETISFTLLTVYDVDDVQSSDDFSAKVVFSPDGKFLNSRTSVSAAAAFSQEAGGRTSTFTQKIPAKVKAILDRYMPSL